MKDTVIFSLTQNQKLTKEVCKKLEIEIGDVKIDRFADGEFLTQAQTSVRGKDVFIIQSTSLPVNDSIMELLIFVDSLKRASAKSITAIIPYFGYSRQDRKAEGRQPITSKLIANLLQQAGVSSVVTFDLHAPQIQGFFDIPTDNLKALSILRKEIQKEKLEDVVVASPDYGGLKRARSFASKLDVDASVATIDKIRNKKNHSKVQNVFGNVKNKNVILVDDLIDTGGSIMNAAEIFKQQGAKKIIVACTHPVFSKGAAKKLNDSKNIDKIFITNSIDLENEEKFEKIKVISLAKFISDVIKAYKSNTSISLIYRKYSN